MVIQFGRSWRDFRLRGFPGGRLRGCPGGRRRSPAFELRATTSRSAREGVQTDGRAQRAARASSGAWARCARRGLYRRWILIGFINRLIDFIESILLINHDAGCTARLSECQPQAANSSLPDGDVPG